MRVTFYLLSYYVCFLLDKYTQHLNAEENFRRHC